MAYRDSVKFTTTTTGTGALTVGAALDGWQAPQAADDGKSFDYRLEHDTGSGIAWENGRGTYTHAGTTFSRDTISASSTGSILDLGAGTKIVALTINARSLRTVGEDDIAGARTVGSADLGRQLRYTGAGHTWTIDAADDSGIVAGVHAGTGTLTFVQGAGLSAYNAPASIPAPTAGTTTVFAISYSGGGTEVSIGTQEGGGGVSTFLALTDTPGSFSGHALKGARVNAAETALEFAQITAVATTLDAQIVNVKDHGVIGDDATINTTPLNAAIAAANALSGRRTLWIPPAAARYRFDAPLTTVATGVDVIMEQELYFVGTQQSGVLWQIGSESTQSVRVRHRLRAANSAPTTGVVTPGQCMFYCPNVLMCDIEIVRVTGFYTAFRSHAMGGTYCWGTLYWPRDLRGNTVCMDLGARATSSWFNSNAVVGPGALEGHASATDDTYGILALNTGGGISGNDNLLDRDLTLQSLDFGAYSDQPHYIVVRSGRFESVTTCFSYDGAGDSAEALAEFNPSHTRNITTAVERRGGTNQYMSLRYDRRNIPLIWGGHPMQGFGSPSFTMPTADGAPGWEHSGTDITTDAPITIPSIVGWQCILEIGADTHDITWHNGTSNVTLDISAAGLVAGDRVTVKVKASNQIRVDGRAGHFTEADFA